MNAIQIPESLTPDAVEQAKVAAKISPMAIDRSLSKMEELLGQSGMVKIGMPVVRLIHSLGVEAETVGVLTLTRGYGIMTHQALLNSMQKLAQVMERAQDDALVTKAGYAIGYVSGQMGKLSKSMTEAENDDKELNRPDPMPASTKRRTFGAGSIVMGNTVHVHAAPANQGNHDTEIRKLTDIH